MWAVSRTRSKPPFFWYFLDGQEIDVQVGHKPLINTDKHSPHKIRQLDYIVQYIYIYIVITLRFFNVFEENQWFYGQTYVWLKNHWLLQSRNMVLDSRNIYRQVILPQSHKKFKYLILIRWWYATLHQVNHVSYVFPSQKWFRGPCLTKRHYILTSTKWDLDSTSKNHSLSSHIVIGSIRRLCTAQSSN